MNFEGRWKTNNGTVVAVHPLLGEREGKVKYSGHDLCPPPKQQPMEYDPIKRYLWDEMGDCLTVYGYAGPAFYFGLSERVNPQRPEYGMKTEGCKECEEWEKRLG